MSPSYMESESRLLCQTGPATDSHSEPNKYSSHIPFLSIRINFNIILIFRLKSSYYTFLLKFLNKHLQKKFLSPTPATRPSKIIYLNSIIIINFMTSCKYLAKRNYLYKYILQLENRI